MKNLLDQAIAGDFLTQEQWLNLINQENDIDYTLIPYWKNEIYEDIDYSTILAALEYKGNYYMICEGIAKTCIIPVELYEVKTYKWSRKN